MSVRTSRIGLVLSPFGLLLLVALSTHAVPGQPAEKDQPPAAGELRASLSLKTDFQRFRTPNSREETFFWGILDFGKAEAAKEKLLPVGPQGLRAALDGSTVSLDTDGDGKMDWKVPSRPKVLNLELATDDGQKVPYFLEVGELTQETLWGRRTQDLRSEKRVRVCYRRACYASGEILGQPVAILDDNHNGRFDDFGQDSIVLGREPRGVLLSPLVFIRDKLYQLHLDPWGRFLTLRESPVPMGTLRIRFPGRGKLEWLALKFESPIGSVVVFDVAGKEKIDVPAGIYSVHSGVLSQGAGKRGDQVQIRGAAKEKKFQLVEGKEFELVLDGPFRLDFEVEQWNDGLRIDPTKIHVAGAAGERYLEFFPAVLAPTVLIKDAAGKQVAKSAFKIPEKHFTDGDYQRLAESLAHAETFRWDAKGGLQGPFSVQLTSDVPLFGKLQSDWKK